MGEILSTALNIAFNGLAYAMVLYLISVGLSVTMGLMGFVNLAHGVFAMAGGYAVTSLMKAQGVPSCGRCSPQPWQWPRRAFPSSASCTGASTAVTSLTRCC